MTRDYLKWIDTQTKGRRYDVTPLFSRIEAFTALVDDLAHPFKDRTVDLVAGIDALGFILGTALAVRLGVGFLPIRKGGKLPVDVYRISFVDYSGEDKQLEVRRDAFKPGARILLVDEWAETGAQLTAAVRLVEELGGVVAGLAAIQMDDHPNTRVLRSRYFCHTLDVGL
jgi:adenine phosphoribosyltransferase